MFPIIFVCFLLASLEKIIFKYVNQNSTHLKKKKKKNLTWLQQAYIYHVNELSRKNIFHILRIKNLFLITIYIKIIDISEVASEWKVSPWDTKCYPVANICNMVHQIH